MAKELTPWKKPKVIIDCSLCIMCQQAENQSKAIVKNVNAETLKKVISLCKERDKFGDVSVREFLNRMNEVCVEEVIENAGFYHKQCYSDFGNVKRRDRAVKRFNEAIEQNSSVVTKRKAGRPSKSSVEEAENENLRLRSSAIPYDQNLCVICQKPGGICRTVMLLETGKSMLAVAEKLEDKSFFLRLRAIPSAQDAVANKVKYHLKVRPLVKESHIKVRN